MRLYYYAGFEGVQNFGDELNPYIWNMYFPELFDNKSNELFVGIGTLINTKIPKADKTVIMGSGVGYGDLPCKDAISSWSIYCLRGKLSADKLGVSSDLVASDPAILMSKFFTDRPVKKYKFAYMPHWMNMGSGWNRVCESLGMKLIDPLSSIEEVVKAIQESEVVITEAMHGAIVSDALRVPWVATHSSFGDYFPFKWEDWCSSLDLKYSSMILPRVWHPEDVAKLPILKKIIKKSLLSINHSRISGRLKQISQEGKPTLSSDYNFKLALEKVENAVDKFKHDMESGKY